MHHSFWDMAAQMLIFPCLELLTQAVRDFATASFSSFLKPVLVCFIPVAMFHFTGEVSKCSMSGHSLGMGEAVPEGSSTVVQEPTTAASKAVDPAALTE